MLRPSEAQLRLLDSAVRLSLEDDGLLAFVLQMQNEAVTQGSLQPAAESAKYLGEAIAWNKFHKFLLSIPARLEQVDQARKQPQR